MWEKLLTALEVFVNDLRHDFVRIDREQHQSALATKTNVSNLDDLVAGRAVNESVIGKRFRPIASVRQSGLVLFAINADKVMYRRSLTKTWRVAGDSNTFTVGSTSMQWLKCFSLNEGADGYFTLPRTVEGYQVERNGDEK